MRKLSMLAAGASALSIAAFASVPAGAIQVAPNGGAGAANLPIVQAQFEGKGRFGGGSSAGNRGPSGPRSSGPSFNGRGSGGPSFSGRSVQQRSVRGPSGPTVNRNFNRNDAPRVTRRGDSGPYARTDGRRDGKNWSRNDGKNWSRHDGKNWDRHDGKRWNGRLVRRGWSRDHRYAFYGAVLVGVPLGYAMIEGNPCYDWTYGPSGWGYYWNYYRCPV
jgi:hypothetical protein